LLRLGSQAAWLAARLLSEPNLRVVRELDTENDGPKMHLTVLVVELAD
jgi:hypothetical protein